jgi:hypothetical protein
VKSASNKLGHITLKTAVEPLPVLHLLESTRTYSCLGFHQSGALRSSCSSTHNNALDGPKMASTAVFKITKGDLFDTSGYSAGGNA